MRINLEKGPKKTAIVSFNVRLTLQGDHVRTVDLFYLREYLMKVYGRSEVDFVNRRIKADDESNNYFVKNAEDVDFNDYDEIIIYNSRQNVFGGVFCNEAISTFIKMYDFKGDVWYFLCDPNLFPFDFAKFISYKRYGEDFVKTSKGPVKISDEFCKKWSEKVYSRMKILFTGCDYELYMRKYTALPKKGKYFELGMRDINTEAEWAFLPLFEYYSEAERYEQKIKNHDFNREYDLVYFGNNRQSDRNKIIKTLYDNENFHNFIIGYDPGFNNCKYDFIKYVNHDKLFELIPSKAYATLIIGDDMHNDNMKTARFFESLLLDVVGFIWTKYDSKRMFIKNEELKNFIYVSTSKELQEKVDKIKSDESFFRHIVELERQEVHRIYNESINNK